MTVAPQILLFPGQGTETVGMSAGWDRNDAWTATLEAAEAHTGYPLRRFMAEGPLEDLIFQRHAPCAVLAHSVGIYRAHRAAGMPLPQAATGHSMGFYSALVAAEVVPLEATLDLISAVEDLSEGAFAPGSMGMAYVMGVSEMDVRDALTGFPELALSNRNGKAQFTISGSSVSLEALIDLLRPTAFRVGLLPVQHPLHGPHMVTLLPALTRRLTHVIPSAPAFPLLSHFDGRWLVDATAWDEGISSIALPVDWLCVVDRLRAMGSLLAECGHGSQLSGLTRWVDRDLTVMSLQAPPEPG